MDGPFAGIRRVLRELRVARGYTQEQMARFIGRDGRTWQKYETGRTDIPLSRLDMALAALGVDLPVLHKMLLKRRSLDDELANMTDADREAQVIADDVDAMVPVRRGEEDRDWPE